MKKVLCLILLISLFFTACKDQSKTSIPLESSDATSIFEQNKIETSGQSQISTTHVLGLAETDLLISKETIAKQNIETTHKFTMTMENKVQESAPMIIFLSINELKEIKAAFDTMGADDFQLYVEREHANNYMNGMWDYENSTLLLEELCSTYVPLLDGDVQKLDNICFYTERNNIHQLIVFDDDKRASVIINTAKSTSSNELQFNDEAICVSKKTSEKENYIYHLYEYENTDYHFYAEVLIDGTFIVLRSGGIETMEDFEACFNRLSFVKIGDLLNE